MCAAIPLRPDFDAGSLRRLAKRCTDNRQIRRLLALAAVYDGMNRAEAARVGGMDRQTLRGELEDANGPVDHLPGERCIVSTGQARMA